MTRTFRMCAVHRACLEDAPRTCNRKCWLQYVLQCSYDGLHGESSVILETGSTAGPKLGRHTCTRKQSPAIVITEQDDAAIMCSSGGELHHADTVQAATGLSMGWIRFRERAASRHSNLRSGRGVSVVRFEACKTEVHEQTPRSVRPVYKFAWFRRAVVLHLCIVKDACMWRSAALS